MEWPGSILWILRPWVATEGQAALGVTGSLVRAHQTRGGAHEIY